MISRLFLFFLYSLVFFLPIEESGKLGIGTSVAFLLGLGCIMLFLLKSFVQRRIYAPPLALKVAFIFVLWSGVSLGWSNDMEQTLTRVTTLGLNFIFAYLIYTTIVSSNGLKNILMSHVFGCTMALILLFFGSYSGVGGFEGGRATAVSMDQNTLACIFVLGMAFAHILIRQYFRQNIARALFVIYTLLSCLGVLLTGSRAGAIGLIAFVFMYLIVERKFAFTLKGFLSFITIFALGAFILSLVPQNLLDRISEGTGAHTFLVRTYIWEAGLEAWKQAPLLGVGSGTYASNLGAGFIGRVAHNTFISVLVETGLIGLTIYLLYWGLAIKQLLILIKKKYDKNIGLFIIPFIVWLPFAMTLTLESAKVTWLLFAVMVGACKRSRSTRDKVTETYRYAS